MVAAPDVVVCFLAALAHNILVCSLQLRSTVVVVMVVVFTYVVV